jgi:transcription elongation GreA/GreB family factor
MGSRQIGKKLDQEMGMNELTINKAELLQGIIGQVEETLRRMGSGYAAAKQATLDSPHVMKSKREVTGIEASYLANGLAQNIQEREHELRTLRDVRLPESPLRIGVGCVVGVGPQEGRVEHLYFLLPVCGGMEIPLEDGGRTVRILTPGAPVAKALLGKRSGEDVTLPLQPAQSTRVQFLV